MERAGVRLSSHLGAHVLPPRLHHLHDALVAVRVQALRLRARAEGGDGRLSVRSSRDGDLAFSNMQSARRDRVARGGGVRGNQSYAYDCEAMLLIARLLSTAWAFSLDLPGCPCL